MIPTGRTEGERVPQRGALRNVLALRTGRHYALVPMHAIVRVEADDNHVRLVLADRVHRTKSTLAATCRRLGHLPLVRVHRSHAVNAAAVRELRVRAHGEFELVMADGSVLRSGRGYAAAVRAAFGDDAQRSQAVRTSSRARRPSPPRPSR